MAIDFSAHKWAYGEEFTPDKLNHLENGIKAVTDGLNNVEGSMTSQFVFKGSCEYASLPASGNTVNDTYYVTDKKRNYSWNGTGWYPSGVDENDYQAELEANRKAVDELKGDLGEYTIKNNVLKGHYGNNKTVSGITFTPTSNGVTISGTSTATSNYWLDSSEGILDGDGNEYFVDFNNKNKDKVFLDVLDITDQSNTILAVGADTTGSFIAQEGHRFGFRIRVSKNMSIVTETVVPIVSVVKTNRSLQKTMDNIKTDVSNIENHFADSGSITRYYSPESFKKQDGFSIYDMLFVLYDSLNFDTKCSETRIDAFPNTMFSHDSTMVINENIGYCVGVVNNIETIDNPLSIYSEVMLSVVDFNTMNTPTVYSIAKCGDIVGDKTIISGAGVPNCTLIGTMLHIIYSAKLNDNKWYLIHTTFNTSSSEVGTSSICRLLINGTQYDFTTESISIYTELSNPDTFISQNAQIAYYNGYYYTGLCVGTQIRRSIITKTSDLINWEIWLYPNWSNTVYAQYEGACFEFNGKLFYALRLSTNNDASLNNMLIARIDFDTKEIEQEYLISDAGSRACWCIEDNKLYLCHSIEKRRRFEILFVNPTELSDIAINTQGLWDYIYPTVIVNGVTMYIASTATGPNRVVFQKREGGRKDIRRVANRLYALLS